MNARRPLPQFIAPLAAYGARVQRGFTLVEVLVTISILAILTAVAVPSFQTMIASSSLTSTTNDVMTTLAQARSEAVRTGSRVTMCKSADGSTCVVSGDWEQGWIVFNDYIRGTSSPSIDVDNAAVPPVRDITTAVNTKVPGNIVIKATVNYVSFAADGRPKLLLTGDTYSGTIRICSTDASLANDKRARDIKLTANGRSVISTPAGIDTTCSAPT